MRRFASVVSTALVGFWVSANPLLADLMYVNDSANHLLGVDAASGAADRIGTTDAQFTDIAFSPEGVLYGVTPSYLYEIDAANGWSRLIGAHGFGGPGNSYGIDALAFAGDGTLYAAGDDILISIDPVTGRGTRLGSLSGFRSAGDLVVDPIGRLLVSTDSGDLAVVDPKGNGAASLGKLPYADIYALAAAADGTLYGIRSTNQIVTIDPDTAAAVATVSLHADFLIGRAWGASYPVGYHLPEPSGLLICAVGLGLWRPGRGRR